MSKGKKSKLSSPLYYGSVAEKDKGKGSGCPAGKHGRKIPMGRHVSTCGFESHHFQDEHRQYQVNMLIASLIFAGTRGLHTSTIADLLGVSKKKVSLIATTLYEKLLIWEDDDRIGVLENALIKYEQGESIWLKT